MSIRNDGPVRIGNWTPENYDQKYRGEVTLADALANSLNTIAAQLVMEVGPQNVVKVAHRLGIDSEMQANASIALGTSEVSLVELTSAYAPFMNGGFKATPHVIRRISKADGTVLYENTYDNPPRVLDPAIVSEMNQMMVRVLTNGTGKKAPSEGLGGGRQDRYHSILPRCAFCRLHLATSPPASGSAMTTASR